MPGEECHAIVIGLRCIVADFIEIDAVEVDIGVARLGRGPSGVDVHVGGDGGVGAVAVASEDVAEGADVGVGV